MSNLPPPPPNSSPGMFTAGFGASSGGGYQLATAGQRIKASLLDCLLMVVTLGIGWIIWSVVLLKESTSPAKKMLGLRIVDVNTGGPATMTQMVMREIIGKWVVGSVTGVIHLASFVMLFVVPKRQTVWDFIGTTTVAKV